MHHNIRVTHRNGAIKHIYTNCDPRRDHQQIVLYSFCRSMRFALHLAVKILLQIFLYEDLSTLPYIHLSVVFPPRMPAGPHFVTQPILLSETLNIWHKSSLKHKEVRPDWNDKNDTANYAPYHMEGATKWLRLALKKYLTEKKGDLDCELFYSWIKTLQPSSFMILSSHR